MRTVNQVTLFARIDDDTRSFAGTLHQVCILFYGHNNGIDFRVISPLQYFQPVGKCRKIPAAVLLLQHCKLCIGLELFAIAQVQIFRHIINNNRCNQLCTLQGFH